MPNLVDIFIYIAPVPPKAAASTALTDAVPASGRDDDFSTVAVRRRLVDGGTSWRSCPIVNWEEVIFEDLHAVLSPFSRI